jgi:hypothetical protein
VLMHPACSQAGCMQHAAADGVILQDCLQERHAHGQENADVFHSKSSCRMGLEQPCTHAYTAFIVVPHPHCVACNLPSDALSTTTRQAQCLFAQHIHTKACRQLAGTLSCHGHQLHAAMSSCAAPLTSAPMCLQGCASGVARRAT